MTLCEDEEGGVAADWESGEDRDGELLAIPVFIAPDVAMAGSVVMLIKEGAKDEVHFASSIP